MFKYVKVLLFLLALFIKFGIVFLQLCSHIICNFQIQKWAVEDITALKESLIDISLTQWLMCICNRAANDIQSKRGGGGTTKRACL